MQKRRRGEEEVGAASAGETMTGGRRRETCRSAPLFSCRRPSGRDGAGFSASEWPGCGSEGVAVRRAEARRGPGRSAFPVTRAGSRAGPFRSIPWWSFGKCRDQRMPRAGLHRHRPMVGEDVRRMTYFRAREARRTLRRDVTGRADRLISGVDQIQHEHAGLSRDSAHRRSVRATWPARWPRS